MKKTYGITLKTRTEKQRPVAISLTSQEGTRVIKNAARRVMATHHTVIKALAKR